MQIYYKNITNNQNDFETTLSKGLIMF